MTNNQIQTPQRKWPHMSELLQHILHTVEAGAEVQCFYRGGMPYGYRPWYAECHLVGLKVERRMGEEVLTNTLVLIEQRKPGQLSITNASEQIATLAANHFQLHPLYTAWIHRYAGEMAEWDQCMFREMTYDWKVSRRSITIERPRWWPIPEEEEARLIGMFATNRHY